MNWLRSVFTWVSGISFITLMFPVTCLIWFAVFPFDSERRLVHRWLRFQGRALTRIIPIWSFSIEGGDKIDPGQAYVIICNHQSILDIFLLNNIRCDFRWVSKAENFGVPILGLSMRMARYIKVERGNKESVLQMMDEALASLNNNISVMMFPEGTRSKSSVPGPFKPGAFQLAMKADKPILPVVIEGTWAVLPKYGRRFVGGHRLYMKVLDPVFPGSFKTGDEEELAGKFRKIIIDEINKIGINS